MIPLELTLKNFLSYREATMNFRGLHTACICGKNGSGKSGLLEAIAWSLWGKSRAASEDDLIHIGTSEMRVDLVFSKDEQTYRVIRSRQRKGPSTLEFQVQTLKGFSSLTAGKMRATQQLITQQLKLDYETFVNSAYLRQGGSDEFMLKGPTERKQILAKLLSLDQYDSLAEKAKERSRLLKGQVDLQAHRLSEMERERAQDSEIAEELANLEKETAALSASQYVTRQQLQSLQTLYHQQQTQQQQLSWHRSQYRVLSEECDRLQQELTAATQKQREIESLLETKSAILEAYAHFQHLQEREEVFAAKFQAHQAAQAQLQQLLATKAEQVGELQKQLRKSQAQLQALCQQEQELQQTLSQQSEVEAGLQQLRLGRDRLAYLDRLQLQVAPLLRRRQQLESQLERDRAYLSAKLEELQTSLVQMQEDRARAPQLQEAAQEIQDRIQQLEKQRIYQQRVLEKGQERRHFMERLQADQRSYETQLGELNQKIQMLNGTRIPCGSAAQSTASTDESQENESFGVCPLCDRPLDEHHWHLVQQIHLCQQQEILDRLWVVREQLATSDREIQILRTEYQELDLQLRQLTPALEKRGELQARLDVKRESLVRLHTLDAQATKIEQSLSTGEYAAPLQAELRLIEERLHALNYDEKDHALVKGQVNRWRWAEIKQGEIKAALKRQKQINTQHPEQEARIAEIYHTLEQLEQTSPLQRQIESLEQDLESLGYNLDEHNSLRTALRQAQPAQLRYQQLLQAEAQYPQLVQATRELTERSEARTKELMEINSQIEALAQQLATYPDATTQIKALEAQLSQGHEQTLNEQHARLGRLQQQQQHLITLETQYQAQQQQLQSTQRQYRVAQELAHAFGKKGIPALMIENLLPQLEAETNFILGRLCGDNQLHVQFVTQKAGRSPKNKLIDTLDILIADTRGTRPYETYSGGEAFRVNFAIRLALARLLAQRSGTSLQMLIVDEGFGTQDLEGCDRLVAAINAIAPDMSCILTITHMPYLKSAFGTCIEVTKTALAGSQLSLSI
ncbi:MAG: AAA family ATPase [Hormoscilla sp. SP5CHS1]|nr:AAA family ATPase [Hormoscilla sp. SP12CHS1]MBC6452291.1 AAA family ATPase [Hormoscilla sp. SP5CHS1]